MDADYSFVLISIETYALQLIGHNKIFLGSVLGSMKKLEEDETIKDKGEQTRAADCTLPKKC